MFCAAPAHGISVLATPAPSSPLFIRCLICGCCALAGISLTIFIGLFSLNDWLHPRQLLELGTRRPGFRKHPIGRNRVEQFHICTHTAPLSRTARCARGPLPLTVLPLELYARPLRC
jgi:hypothetical protein